VPPVPVVLGEHTVSGTAVPEAAINENGQPCPSENNIRPTRQGIRVHPET
jgi:hypothetical protein